MLIEGKKAVTFSLAICTYRRPEAIRKLLERLRDAEECPPEIVIVDSSPDLATEDAVGRFKDLPIKYYHVGTELRGLTKQRNFAIGKCGGDIVLFFDDDIIPSADFFVELRRCWERNPEAVGVGGYILGETWKKCDNGTEGSGWFCVEGWARREPMRWRVRKVLRLASELPPGWIPPEGHGRPIGCYPPDGKDRRVEFVMGGVASWKKEILREILFSSFFEGYGLYEDLDFCIRAGRKGPIYLCTRATVEHHHDPSGRPYKFKYGRMVVRNGWYVWRQRWPSPPLSARLKWWGITFLLLLLRAPQGGSGFVEACGRLAGAVEVIWRPPKVSDGRQIACCLCV